MELVRASTQERGANGFMSVLPRVYTGRLNDKRESKDHLIDKNCRKTGKQGWVDKLEHGQLVVAQDRGVG